MIFNPTDGTSVLDEIAHPQWTQTTAFGLTSAPQLGNTRSPPRPSSGGASPCRLPSDRGSHAGMRRASLPRSCPTGCTDTGNCCGPGPPFFRYFLQIPAWRLCRYRCAAALRFQTAPDAASQGPDILRSVPADFGPGTRCVPPDRRCAGACSSGNSSGAPSPAS